MPCQEHVVGVLVVQLLAVFKQAQTRSNAVAPGIRKDVSFSPPDLLAFQWPREFQSLRVIALMKNVLSWCGCASHHSVN